MIGNKIKYYEFSWADGKYVRLEKEGLVVDAWTEISSEYKSSSFLGIGDAKGKVESKRIYKVEHRVLGTVFYKKVPDHNLIEIVEFNCIKSNEVREND